jgi:hypothetical protein
METQYYTPIIEDFYVGFECEFKNGMQSNKWEVVICDQDMVSIAYDAIEHSENFKEEFRVKCLDEEDIIDLGWQRVSEDYFEIKRSSDYSEITKFKLLFSLDELTEKFYHTTIFADVELGDIKIDMMRLGFDNIKNKSELKRIMQMLKIIE